MYAEVSMQIGSASSSSLGNGFQNAVFAQGVNSRKNSKLDAILTGAPASSTASAEAGAQASSTASPQNIPTAASSETLLTGGDSSNLMARNFVKLDFQQSKYVDASLQAAKQEQSAVASMNAMITGLSSVAEMWTAEAAARGSEASAYVNGQLLGFLADTKLDQIKDEETNEASEENLEEIKEDVEAKAEEAVSPEESEDGEASATEGVLAESGAASDATSPESKGSGAANAANAAQTLPTEKSLSESIELAAEAATAGAVGSSEGATALAASATQAASAAQGASAGGVATAVAPKSVNIFV